MITYANWGYEDNEPILIAEVSVNEILYERLEEEKLKDEFEHRVDMLIEEFRLRSNTTVEMIEKGAKNECI